MSSTDRGQYKQLFGVIAIILAILTIAIMYNYENRPSNIYLDKEVADKILSQMNANEDKETSQGEYHFNQNECQKSILTYLIRPAFRNSDFTSQITNTGATLEFFQLNEKVLYFSHPKEDFDRLNRLLLKV